MHSRPPSRLKADLLLVLVAFIWGTAFVAQSFAVKAGLAFLYNGASFLLGAFALAPLLPRQRLPRAQWGWMAAAGALLFAGSALQQVGLFYTRVANASFLTSLYVVFTPFLLWLGYRERTSVVDAIAVALAVAGAFLLSAGGALVLAWGDALELLGALFWGLHLLLIAKRAAHFESLSFAAGQFVVCGLLNLAVGVVLEPLPALLEGPVLAATVYRALLSIGVGYTLQVWGQKHTPPTDAGLIFALESVFAALVAWLVLGETLTLVQGTGCALILGAAALSQLKPAPHTVTP